MYVPRFAAFPVAVRGYEPFGSRALVLEVGRIVMWQSGAMFDRTKDNLFCWRGELSPKKFKCLKTCCRAQAPRVRLSPVVPRFAVLSRDELGGH